MKGKCEKCEKKKTVSQFKIVWWPGTVSESTETTLLCSKRCAMKFGCEVSSNEYTTECLQGENHFMYGGEELDAFLAENPRLKAMVMNASVDLPITECK